MASRKAKNLCCVNGRYRRTIGKFVNANQKVSPRKFLLGTDRDHAERTNLRLEQLWRDIEKHWRDDSLGRACDGEPIWEPLTLGFAEAVRKGQRITLPEHEIEKIVALSTDRSAVANWYWWVRATYPSIADIIDEPTHSAFHQSRKAAADHAGVLATLSHRYATLADQPTAASAPGHTLHAALDAWAVSIRQQKTRHDGVLLEGGRKIIEAANRFKGNHDNVPLDQLDFDTAKMMADYWCSRPPSQAKGKHFGHPISVVTVRNMLGYLRRFLVWLHRNRNFQWRDTDRIIEDALGNRRTSALQTPEEIKRTAQGPDTWTVNELTKLYETATDRVRLYMLLGLNGGFAQSEIVHLLKDEIHFDHDPPDVRYIRHKTKKSAAFILWPETIKGLQWVESKRVTHNSETPTWAILGHSGQSLTRQRITNAWNRLIAHVQHQNPGSPRLPRLPRFRSLPFKTLRKTNAELISQCGGDSEVVAIIHGRAKRTPHDDQADVYYRRRLEKVHPALTRLHKKLQPMFASADDAFAANRKRPRSGKQLSYQKVQKIRKLRSQNVSVVRIAQMIGCSPSTVSNYTKSNS